jgi:Phosphate-selective porin O and P
MSRSVIHRGHLKRVAILGWIFLLSVRSHAQVLVKVSDSVFFRLGTLMQFWADGTQDPVSGGYSQNLFLRRVRFIVSGQIAERVTFFFQTENSRLGNATATAGKNTATGFIVQDAFGEWRIAGDLLALDAGLLFAPQSRDLMTVSSTCLSFDVSSFSSLQTVATQSSGGRDVGFQLKGYLLGDHLEYRAGVFDGQRQLQSPAGAGSRNPPRFAARLQYDAFDVEKGYAYPRTNRGAKRILAIGAWNDRQGAFQAWGLDATLDLPLANRDALTVGGEYFAYDGHKQFTQIANGVVTDLLPRQHAYFTDAGYYLAALAVQPFLRYETLRFADSINLPRDQTRYGAGLNWYVSATNMKVSALEERIVSRVLPAGASRRVTNRVAIQLQFVYY